MPILRFALFSLPVWLSFSLLSADIESEAKLLENELIARCCWRAPLSEHYSGEAPKMKAEIREMLGKGMDRRQIKDFYVAKYGERILSAPPKSGFHLLSYILPVLALMLGGVGVAVFYRKTRVPAAVAQARSQAPASEDDDRYLKQLQEELRETD